MDRIDLYIESLIFASENPVSFADIKLALERYSNYVYDDETISENINGLIEKYQSDEFSFQIIEISDGYAFTTRKDFHEIIGEFLKITNKSKLSKSSLETLAIIAYNQPATKPLVEQMRGVNSDYSIQKLLDKNLIEITGREDAPGKPLVYRTSQRFLDYFGIKSLKDLPKLKEFYQNQNSVGIKEEE